MNKNAIATWIRLGALLTLALSSRYLVSSIAQAIKLPPGQSLVHYLGVIGACFVVPLILWVFSDRIAHFLGDGKQDELSGISAESLLRIAIFISGLMSFPGGLSALVNYIIISATFPPELEGDWQINATQKAHLIEAAIQLLFACFLIFKTDLIVRILSKKE